jgi:dipeptidyl aminopeptidase/acylaminoacyl peptidase
MEEKLMPDFDFDTRKPREPNEPNNLRIPVIASNLRNLLVANRPRAFLIGGGILLFVVVAVSVLAGRYYYGYGSMSQSPSPPSESKEPDRSIPTHPTERTELSVMPAQPCERIDPDRIRNGKIAFDLADEAAPVVQDPEGMGISPPDVWTASPNGSDPVNLTTNSRDFDEAPAWSPDGARIAFANRNPNDQSGSGGRICVMDPHGFERVEISLREGESVYEPSWSPDGRRIAFWSPTTCDIFLANADGSGTPKRLLIPGFSGCAARPEWSPDGGRIAFEGTGEDSGINIYVMNVSPEGHASGLRRLTDNRFFYEKPAWSPDGTEIAFATNRDRGGEIYKIDVKSLRMTRLTHTPRNVQDTQPTWSPDGEQIAYVKQKLAGGTHSSIYRMDSDGSNSTPVFEEERKYAFNPDWAPSSPAAQDEPRD